MTETLQELRQRRLKWVEANRENGFDEGINRLLTELYPYNAHFIYELLQNAEDPGASAVRFTLTDSQVAFEHDGQRLFDLADVESITSIGNSTKRDDPTSIGKFGVGFKAVFEYTNTPEIHSGDFHFRIRDLVVPEPVGMGKPAAALRTTRFVFPFDNPRKLTRQTVEETVEEVEQGLRALGDNTLLFLSHIRKIDYTLPDGSAGSLERLDHPGGRIEIRASHPGGAATVSHWLHFQKEVAVVDDDGKQKSCRVAIAYRLVEEESKKGGPTWKIVALERGEVSIFFPAEKETSNLRFHLHAPFASTVARDSVRDCKANQQLRDHVAGLVVESHAAIRDQRLLTVGFLAVLPNPADNLAPFYEPIRKAIVHAFQNEALTPTRSGTHAPASTLYRGPARIAEVLNDEDLSLLTGYETPLWVANPPQQNQREDRFLDSLEIDTWGWAELAETINNLDSYEFDDDEDADESEDMETNPKRRFENWISQKDDAGLMRFYALLGEAKDAHDEYIIESDLRIVRVGTISGDKHVLAREAFFPPDESVVAPKNIFLVKPTVYMEGRSEAQKKYSYNFLHGIGVKTFNEKTSIESRLEKYCLPSRQIGNKYYDDIKQFIAYWKKNPNDALQFREESIFLGASQNGKPEWRKARDLCLDMPFLDTGLSSLGHIHGKAPVWTGYSDKLTEVWIADFVSFLAALGAMFKLTVEPCSTNNNPRVHEIRQDWYRSTRWTNLGIDQDYTILHLEKYLKMCSISTSRLVWDALVKADRKCSTACFRPNQKYDTRPTDSQLVHHLKSHAWIPDRQGQFRKPQDMSRDDLLSDFPYDDRNGLLTAIGFGENAKKRDEEYRAKNHTAQNMGFADADRAAKWAEVDKLGISPDEILAQRKRAEQPEESVGNPERRRKGVLERRENALSKESVTRERSIQPGAKQETLEARAYLRDKYRNSEDQIICQCCRSEMPFKVNGDYYLEAVQCVRGHDHHYFENRLALCPTCAAMYQHAKETNDAEIHRLIVGHEADDQAPAVEIPVRLAGRDLALRFVGTHWFDLKTVLCSNSGS